MPVPSNPNVRRYRLGAELRQLRVDRGMTGDDVCAQVGWPSNSKLSRIERGQSRPDLADVMDLLDVYGVIGAKREELIAVARDAASTRGWYRAVTDMGQRQRDSAELEASAAEIREYTQFMIPGLLQTPAYARARTTSGRELYPELDIEAEAKARLPRQVVLRRTEPALEYEAVIEEAALVRSAAADEVMTAQLQHLVELSERPNVTIRVLPLRAKVGEYYLPHAAFSLYGFPDPNDPEIVALETVTSDFTLRDAEDVGKYRTVFGWLWDAALPPEESAAHIGRLAEQH